MLNIDNNPLLSKMITHKNKEIEFKIHLPKFTITKLLIKIKADFEKRLLLLNGFVMYRTHPSSHYWKKKDFENVIMARW
jgi:hypothetical protein